MAYLDYEKDKDYLINKFRNPVFDETTGMDYQTLYDNMPEVAEKYRAEGFSKPEVKALCFRYICENMYIDVNPHDCFPAFGVWQRGKRPFAPVIRRWMDEYCNNEWQDILEEYNARNKAGFHKMFPDFDHSVPDWDAMYELGFPGLLERAEKYRAMHRENGTLTAEAESYFNGLAITMQAVLDCIGRFIKYAREHYPSDPRIRQEINCLENLQHGAPGNTYEVLMFIYLHFIFCEHIDHYQVRSLGNLDRLILPYYQRDLAENRYTVDDIRGFFTYFLMQFASINNYWGHPFYLGGTRSDGTTEYSELSYLILDVFDKLSIPTPKIQLKIARNTPEKLLNNACDMIRRGNSSLVFVSEEAMSRILNGCGCSAEDARCCHISGCYEFAPRGKSNTTGAGYINLLKPFDLIFNDGIDPVSKLQSPCRTLKLPEIKTFDDFFHTYLDYVTEITEMAMELCKRTESDLAGLNPANLFSITIESSLEKARDAFCNGLIYNNSGLLTSGMASVVDSLMMVKKFVFDLKELSLEEFRKVLAANYQGYEKLRLKILNSPEKYGNGIDEVDKYAREITRYLGKLVNGRPNSRNGAFHLSGHTAKQYYQQGKLTGATPDGRLAGEEMSKNLSPVMGMDRNGATAVIKSVTTIDSMDLPGDFPLDMMLHPATVAGDEGLAAMRALIFTYFKKHGHAIHFNIFDADTLIDAQQNPEKYSGLQIRVCGWNTRFNEMAKEEQDFYIERARNIIE
ncbi:MAG: hypothetical protein J6S19_02220 [Lentisphaeria bacterium]|nr:hypothetical protein [Lentisphaeria bacterium]